MTIDKILERSGGSPVKLIELTGGEPLMQRETVELTERLIEKDYTVLIETNGSIDIGALHSKTVIIMDIKTPSSGMSDKMLFNNVRHLKKSDEVKFVLSDRRDYEWSLDIMKRYELTKRCNVLFSPVSNALSPDTLAGWMLKDSLHVRLNLQMHKYIFREKEDGLRL